MAYWTIDFTTRAGRHIHIRISGKSGDTNVALTPSDNPCSIEEEGKENLFMPIKTQSGYVEVITDSIDLAAEIIPTTGGTRNVIIYETATPTSYTTPLWAGYVQPKLLTFKMWRGKQKLQIPIECRLSGLKYEPVRLPSTSEVSIGMILYRMMGGFDYAYFQGGIVMERNGNTSDQERAWLRKKVYTTLFDEDMTQYDVLEKVCTFFGWTVRQHGISAYFVANRNVDATNTTVRRILTTELTASEYTSEESLWSEVELDGDVLASTSNSVKFTEGCRIAKATCSLVTFDREANIDFTLIGEAIDDGSISSANSMTEREWSSGGHDYYEIRQNFWTSFGQSTPVTIGDFTVKGENVQALLEKNDSTDVNDWDAKLVVWFTADYNTDTYMEGGTPSSPAYERTDVTIQTKYFGELTFVSVEQIEYSTKGTLVVKAQTDTEFNKFRGACFFVKIGSQWYNPVANVWQSTKPSSYIKLEPDNNDGYSIPIPQAMTGNLSLIFVSDKDDINHYGYSMNIGYALKSISAEFTAEQAETYNSQISEAEYSAKNGAGFDKEVSFSSLITIRGMLEARSKNFLLDSDGEICAGLYDTPYSDARLFSPLQRLCDQAAAEMSKVGRMYDMVALWRRGLEADITPLTMIYIEPLSEWCYPVSIKYNLREDEVQLRMVKRDYSEGNQ